MPTRADARTVAEGYSAPLDFMVRTGVDVLRGKRSPARQARDIAQSQGFYNADFARLAISNPRAALDAINSFNNWYQGPPNRANPAGGANRPPPKPGTYGGAAVGSITLQSVLDWATANLPGTRVTVGPSTPPINPTPRPGPVNVTGGPNPGVSATEIWLAREREILARAEAMAGRGGGFLPRVLGGAASVITGALWPSTIGPEEPIPQYPLPTPSSGPTKRYVNRRPTGPLPGSGPIKSPTPTSTYTGPVGDSSALPTDSSPVEIAPGPVSIPYTRPITAGPGTSGGTSPWANTIKQIAPYLLPFILPTSSSGRRTYTDPLSPTWPGSTYDPLTPLNPGSVGSTQTQTSVGPGQGQDRCSCESQRNRKRKKRSKRTICYQGTYTEKASGLIKRKKRKVPCK